MASEVWRDDRDGSPSPSVASRLGARGALALVMALALLPVRGDARTARAEDLPAPRLDQPPRREPDRMPSAASRPSRGAEARPGRRRSSARPRRPADVEHLPMALVVGPAAAAAGRGHRRHRRRRLPRRADRAPRHRSSDAMGAAALRAAGLTGEGRDRRGRRQRLRCHPPRPGGPRHAQRQAVQRRVRQRAARLEPDRSSSPNEVGPYQNTDLGGGHGTHVAGIIAADWHDRTRRQPARRRARTPSWSATRSARCCSRRPS